MGSKIIAGISLSMFLILFSAEPVSARRLLPRASSGTPTARSGGAVTASGPSAKIRFRPDRLAIIATFSNLNQASSVSYLFSYNSRGTTQGAQGSVKVSEGNTSREILFGTCSHGVCRYDYGISNAKFVVTFRLLGGRRIVKTFTLKV